MFGQSPLHANSCRGNLNAAICHPVHGNIDPFSLFTVQQVRSKASHVVVAVASASVFERKHVAMSSEPKRVLITGAAGDALAYAPSVRASWSIPVNLMHTAHSRVSPAHYRVADRSPGRMHCLPGQRVC